MLRGSWRHALDLPALDFVVIGWWEAPAVRADLALLPIIDVTPAFVDASAWRAECQRVRVFLAQSGTLGRVRAICVGQELYWSAAAGSFDAVLGGLSVPAKRDAVCSWLDAVGLPIAREVFGVPVTVQEHYFQPSRTPSGFGSYSPIPQQADVLTVLAYAHTAALAAPYPLEAVFDYLVRQPTARALASGKQVHLVGQTFNAPGDELWDTFPPVAWVALTRQYAETTPGIIALSWFLWDSVGALAGLKSRGTEMAAYLQAMGWR